MASDFFVATVTKVAGAVDIKFSTGERIWVPPTGRPYWTAGAKCKQGRCGPYLTDEEIENFVTNVINVN